MPAHDAFKVCVFRKLLIKNQPHSTGGRRVKNSDTDFAKMLLYTLCVPISLQKLVQFIRVIGIDPRACLC
ncbi:hypothetical protein SDC9_109552 [bioreactor metagenome]|uniref:Uncharacterized protein n=1 Tax=bioreactor metagenome TaxID=1076179 RepID=A0A645BB49_9ZZZZ